MSHSPQHQLQQGQPRWRRRNGARRGTPPDRLEPFRQLLGPELPAALAWPPIPLKIGVARDLTAMLEKGAGRRRLRLALRAWCACLAYRRALAKPGSTRHDLARQPVEPVSDAHREHAKAGILDRRPRQGGGSAGRHDRGPRHERRERQRRRHHHP